MKAAAIARFGRQLVRTIVGTPIAAVQHLARSRHVERTTRTVARLSVAPPAIPARDIVDDETQTRADGVGPLVMRSYTVAIAGSEMSPSQLIAAFADDPNSFSPRHVVAFHDADGAASRGLAEGDELVVELPGPWNGPVRVERLDGTDLVLATLDHHMEAGRIHFSTAAIGDDRVRFRIRSWARAGDRVFRFLHLRFPVAREAQTAMWVHCCSRAVRVAGGRRDGPIVVDTEILEGSERE